LLAAALAFGGLSSVLDARPAAAASSQFGWATVANLGDTPAGAPTAFNSFNQPSVNESGVVVFRARTKGSQPVRGIYTMATQGGGHSLTTIAQVGESVPAPNNSSGTFNEFPSFPRIDATSTNVVTRGQSTPVWTYTLNGTDTQVGTSGVYATRGGSLSTGASLLGSVVGQEVYSVPGATAGTRFDQFPGSPAIDGSTIAFKGNYTDGTSGLTGVYYRDLSSPTNAVQLIANSSTVIPGSAAKFGSTAPPSAGNGKLVFTGWDNEDAPTAGGVYLANISPSPTLAALASIGEAVPGESGAVFTNFGEGLSFDGRYVGFWASWGTATQSINLACPSDGQADLIAYCLTNYPNGFTTTVPVHQGIFVYDTLNSTLNKVTTSGTRFSGFQYWVFSGSPPGSGSADSTLEPPRWRASSFVAVSGTAGNEYQVAFKATPVAGGSGIYVGQGPSVQERIITAVQTSEVGTALDSGSPVGTLVSTVGVERDGFRGRFLAINASMLDPVSATGWAGVYVTSVPANLAVESQTITFPAPDPAYVNDTFTLNATDNSGLPITYSVDAGSASVCTLVGATLTYLSLGTCKVYADQAGDAAYSAATQATESIVVSKRPQVITISPVPAAYLGASYTLSASSTSNLNVEFSIDAGSTSVCSVSGATVHYLTLGTCLIDANQSGDATYAAASQVQRSVTVTLQPQVISVSTPPTVYVGGAYTLTATASSGLAVSLSIDGAGAAGSCTLVGAAVHFVTTGTCLIDVNQAGDALHAAAPMVQVTFNIVSQPVVGTPPQPQVITLPPPPPATIGGTYTLSATTDSGLPVTYAVDTTSSAGACTLVGSTVYFDNLGTCVIDVTQSGDATFLPAPSVKQVIAVGAMLSSVKVVPSVQSARFGQAARAIATVTLPSGNASGKVQFIVSGRNHGAPQPVVNGIARSLPLVDSGNRPLQPGSYVITAVFVPDDVTKYASSRGTVTHVVKKAGTKLMLVVHPRTITATALTVAPGVAVATGTVTFMLAGKVVGRAALHNKVATLGYAVKVGQARFVTASYAGSTSLLASSSVRAVVSAKAVRGAASLA
jgi:hypothetical protein